MAQEAQASAASRKVSHLVSGLVVSFGKAMITHIASNGFIGVLLCRHDRKSTISLDETVFIYVD